MRVYHYGFFLLSVQLHFTINQKFYALIIAAILCCTSILPVCAASVVDESNAADQTVVYFTDFSDLSENSTDINTIVLTEEQMIKLGASVKDLFKFAPMVYVLTSKSADEIQKVCDIPSFIHSEDENGNKFATIIELTGTGEYVFNNVSAVYCEGDTVETYSVNTAHIQTTQTDSQLVEDGLDAYLNTKANQLNVNSRMQPSGFYAYATDSAVLYDGSGGRIGTMGYTAYWYKVAKSGETRIFDVICIATFAPDSNYACAKMSVYMGTPFDNHEILEAANIISNGQTYTHSLSLTTGKTGVTGTAGTSWSYTVDAQTVIKSFDMTTNDRTWTFEPKSAGAGDAWIEEPGLRMCSTQERCHTTVKISCPKIGLFGIVTNNNSISSNWFFNWS